MIELSADLGEGSEREEEIWPLIRRANVACGGHFGDGSSMAEAARLARRHGVIVGAHPSYPDRANFGRRSMQMPADELRKSLVAQITELREVAEVLHVKPHGALYNDAHADIRLALVIVEAMREAGGALSLVAADRSQMASAARERGVPVIREAFADRRYMPDGSLVPRSAPAATLTVAEAATQATLLARDGVVVAANGALVPLQFDTLCVHADMEAAVERLQAVRTALGL